ncbi:hypothetical protein VPH35_001677 [Triticum aestivum]|uniref:uncharacterized protein isoform X1 n=1 Tax=Triticum aestivum TaxID=4565 RepID=UPI001D01631A|nr:uncharacterized protein LOC123042556 isoform X1 [Triticum aestivum]XP_044320931.1 uncharacterized protein LOC123042556 isoform X1 [Triticum aestivum]XP_044320937.1 uncharacterized protein LOC123042556 isoform X1 [Triticum aestivum]XP_044320942.1 uncharacterized protein LOC123042556 isoform X1 [Triticum aestivum]XP_044320949.1 uncharacterized protein LOC123042556 isoform X1 [Triticum aestivum]XP_044320955.1 uncharacterized protein LOC123042556 isoform X1 [Triticum aestivum]XP_044320958.1 un
MNTENHQYVADANGFDRVTESEVNKKNIMPASYAGKLRCMTENFHDAVAVSRVHGSPDIFTDFTYDPNWPEIVQGLEHGQQAVDEADFTAQVYQLKLLEYVEKIKAGQVFGLVVTVLHSVDFHKRSLPHAHILVWREKDYGQSQILLAMDDNLFVPLLPKLAATLVTASRQHVLQLSINALRVTASQSVHYDEDDDSFFATVEIHVPAHENIPQFKTTIFAGHNCQTTNAAHESASTTALHYMQQGGILIIDDLNFPELQKCKKEVVRAKSWSDIFEHETVKLKRKIGSLERELASLKENSVVRKPIQQP